MKTNNKNLPLPIETYKLSTVAYSKHRGVSKTAIQRAMGENRITLGYSYILNTKKKNPKYLFSLEATDLEWEQNTTTNGNNIHSIAGSSSEEKKIKPPPQKTNPQIKEKTDSVSSGGGDIFIPGIQKSKEKEAYYNAELKRVKLEEELKNLISYNLVERIFTNLVIDIKKQILSTYPTFKTILGKENADFVDKELKEKLNSISKLKKDDLD